MREARHEAAGDRIAGHHGDRNRARRVLRGHDRLVTDSHDDIHLGVNQLAGQGREIFGAPIRETVFHFDVFAFRIPKLSHPLLEKGRRGGGAETEIADFWERISLRRSND